MFSEVLKFFQKKFQKHLRDKKKVVLLHPLIEREAIEKKNTFIDILD